jgi:hypothetical protein
MEDIKQSKKVRYQGKEKRRTKEKINKKAAEGAVVQSRLRTTVVHPSHFMFCGSRTMKRWVELFIPVVKTGGRWVQSIGLLLAFGKSNVFRTCGADVSRKLIMPNQQSLHRAEYIPCSKNIDFESLRAILKKREGTEWRQLHKEKSTTCSL